MSTDTSLNFVKMMEIYSIRWTIEVMFRELKQHLQLGKCQSRDFDAQIASVTVSLILYTFLAYLRRKSDYETIGGLFALINRDLCEKNLAERIWMLFDELLQFVIDGISKTGTTDIGSFKISPEYQYIKELVEASFLNNQLFELDKSA
jgi:Transposase DDE domain